MRRTVYLDHAATTPVRREVLDAFTSWYASPARQRSPIGNPASAHMVGRAARRLLEDAREEIAAALDAHPTEVIFTSGGTESDNLAVLGTWQASRAVDPTRRRVVISGVEHPAVKEAARALATSGAHLTIVPPGSDGRVRSQDVIEAVGGGADVALVAVQWANGETGVVHDLRGLGEHCARQAVPWHTDAVQAVGHIPVSFADSGAATMALSGHKLGAPVGTGALLVRRDARLAPVARGGGQERGLRPGTVDVAGAHALAVALAAARTAMTVETERLSGLRDRLLRAATAVPGVSATVPVAVGDVTGVLPGHAHLLVEGCEPDSLIYLFDAAGIAVSAGSACHTGVAHPSETLLDMGIEPRRALGALRVTLGWTSTPDDVDRFLAVLAEVVGPARAAGALLDGDADADPEADAGTDAPASA